VKREQGRVKVVVEALDKNNQFLNFLQIQGNLIDPDLKAKPIELTQTAPGRYEATVDNVEASGNYFVNLGYRGQDKSTGVISSGVSVPYSDEYRELRSNPTTLETLASLTDGQVTSWKQQPDGRIDLPRTVDGADHFRRDPGLVMPKTFRTLWPALLWLAAFLFLGDVAVRRVAIDLDRGARAVADWWKRMRGVEVAPSSDYFDKLKSRKAEVGEQLDRSRGSGPAGEAADLFPGSSGAGTVAEPLLEGLGAAEGLRSDQKKSAAPGMGTESKTPAPETYTNRLLKAKQRVWEEREKEKDQGQGRKPGG
jgi:hypothetical protein